MANSLIEPNQAGKTVRIKLGNIFGLAPVGLVLAILTACATVEDRTVKWSDQKLYEEAKEEVKLGNYDSAVGLYEKLEIRTLGTPMAQQAQIEKAYAQYKAAEGAAALITLERFLRLHPASPLTDYALYLKGLVNFSDTLGIFGTLAKQDLSERDSKAAKDSYQSYAELVRRFPQSKYAQDSKLRMLFIQNTLAAGEVHIARYYFSRGAYLAAANRAQGVLNAYPQSLSLEPALELLIASYDALNLQDLRDDAKRVMAASFPKNRLAASHPAASATAQ